MPPSPARALVGALVLAQLASAEVAPPKEFAQETLFGPTRIRGATGNGRVSIGVSEDGEVTVLRWPSPSQFDQLAYRTARGAGGLKKPRYGAGANQGLLLGLAWTQDGQRRFAWLRDAPFTHDLRFPHEDSAVLVDEASDPATGLRVESRWFAPPGQDVLAVRVRVHPREPGRIQDMRLVFFENLAPTRKRLPYVPLYDSLVEDLDQLEYEPRGQLLVHRRARRKLWPFGQVERDTTPDELEALITRDLEDTEAALKSELPGVSVGPFLRPDPEGPVVALGGDRPVAGFQCGPVSRLVTRRSDAFHDAADGELSGRARHRGRSTGALAFDIAPGADGVAEGAVFLGFAREPAAARAAVQHAREAGAAALEAATEAFWGERMGRARLPAALDARERRVFKRALISIMQAQDPVSGMIVASISTQPPYGQDWPRDGAFLNLVLDHAGFHDLVTRHQRFYFGVQRQEDRFLHLPPVAQPRGTFEMSYYADGAPGGPFVFEIDNTALLVWSFWQHAGFLRRDAGDAAVDAYLAEAYPAIRLATQALVDWRDPATGLHRPAYEDDVPALTQLIQGAGSVHLAIRSGIAAGEATGEDPAVLAAWRARLAELDAAILEHLHDPAVGFDRTQGPGAVAWLVWPGLFRPLDHPLMQAESDWLWSTSSERLFGAGGGGAYEQKQLMALLLTRGGDPAWRERLTRAYRLYVDQIATPGTDHYGETYRTRPEGDGLAYESRTSIPHVWAAALVYLTGLAQHGVPLAP